MLRSAKIKKSASDNSSPKNITQELPTKTAITFSKIMTSEGNCFTNFFQKITCSNRKLTNDESEVLIIPNISSK